MDYYKIGQKIRKYRKAHGLSQEQLAEQIGISVTHMSHIETGNTKLSLQVFVEIARCLEVPADELLFEHPSTRKTSLNELEDILETCSTTQLRIITDIARAAKIALEKYTESKEHAL
jgi:transcriptional regulator with XRE-family HTH domain